MVSREYVAAKQKGEKKQQPETQEAVYETGLTPATESHLSAFSLWWQQVVL